MNFLIPTLFWFVGLFLTSFTLIPIIIILRFAFSFTKELKSKHLLKEENDISKRYFISILILTSVFLVVLFVLFNTTGSGFRGFVGGAIISLVFGISKTGKNKDNISDYLQANKRYLKDSYEI